MYTVSFSPETHRPEAVSLALRCLTWQLMPVDEPKPMLHLPPSRPLIRQRQPSSPLSSSSSDWHISSGDGTSAAVIEAQKKHIERLMVCRLLAGVRN